MSYSVSIIVPIYNEEKILQKNMRILEKYLKSVKDIKSIEIILAENGSTDNSLEICKELTKSPKFSFFSLPFPSFGDAIREGFRRAQNEIITILAADLASGIDFIERALPHFKEVPIVMGSRNLKGCKTVRHPIRQIITKVHPLVLKLLYHVEVTDIGSLRAFRRNIGKRIMQRTIADGPLLEVETVLLIANSKLNYVEIPVNHIETRKTHFVFKQRIFSHFAKLIFEFRRLRQITIRN